MAKRPVEVRVKPAEIRLEGDFWQVVLGASWIWTTFQVLLRLLSWHGERRRRRRLENRALRRHL